jgi:Domain of unknown function (DUF4157)
VDTETDQVQAEAERSRQTSHRQIEAPDRVHDQRPPLQSLASAMGNRGFTQLVSRMADGEGILAGGLVHPDVEAAIAASRGTGSSLDRGVSRSLDQTHGDLSDVRVHTGAHAAAMARAVSARAFTVGNDIFFGAGEYRPGTPTGNELIAHEAAHVVQQRGAPMSGPLTVSQPGDALEREAEGLARGVAG